MDDEKLRHMITTLQSAHQGNVPIQIINDYNQIITSFQLSQEGLLWCINNFPHLEVGLLNFAFTTFKIWINSNWEMLNEQIVHNLQNLLFQQAKLTLSSLDSTQAIVQISLFQHLYPEHWPSFWQELVLLNPRIVLNFLQEFSVWINENPNFSGFMKEDNSEILITNFVISNVERGTENALPILIQMLEWIDATPILQSPLMHLIQENLGSSIDFISRNGPENELYQENMNKLLNSMKLLNGIMNSYDIDPGAKNDLLTQFDVINKMMIICQNPAFEEAMCCASSLISSCGDNFISTPFSSQYYQLALLLLSHPSVEVAEPITKFIENYTSISDSSVAQSSFQALIARLFVYFTTNPSEIDDFSNSLLKIISNILHENPGMLDSYLGGALATISPIDMAPVFHILIDAIEDQIPFDRKEEIAVTFSVPLLQELQPPYDDRVYYSVTSYMTYLSKIAAKYLPNASEQNPLLNGFQMMFNRLVNNLVLQYDMDFDFKRVKFIDIANAFVNTRVFKMCVNVSGEQLIGLVRTCDFDRIELASRLLSKFAFEERTAIFNACMQFLNESMSNSPDFNFQKNIIHLILILVEGHVKVINQTVDNAPLIRAAMPYMESVLPIAAANDEIMNLFLNALLNTFQQGGLPLLLSIVENGTIHDMEGLAAACFVALEYAKLMVKSGSNLGWLNDCVSKLFAMAAVMLQKVEDWCEMSEEVKEAVSLLTKFFNMVSCSIKQDGGNAVVVAQFLSVELHAKILAFVGQFSPVLVNLYVPLEKTIEYFTALMLSPLPQTNPEFVSQTLLNTFLPFTLQLFTSPNQPSSEWMQPIFAAARFHQTLMKAFPEMIEERVSQFFASLPQSETTNQFLCQYMEILKGDEISSFRKEILNMIQYIHHILHEI